MRRLKPSHNWQSGSVMSPTEVRARFNLALLPCPFCGSHTLALYVASIEPHVMCGDCGAEGPHVTRELDGLTATYEACQLWNKRG